jgi:hypothetical protein
MLPFSFLLASSLCVLVDRQVAIRLHFLLVFGKTPSADGYG